MSIKQLKDANNITSEKLDDWGTPKTVRKAYLCYNLNVSRSSI
jgi:hypothetical protein